MKKLLLLAGLLLFTGFSAFAQSSPEKELTSLLHTFLKGASANNADMHERFWADELIYTSSSGKRFGKKEIMKGLRDNDGQSDEGAATVYSADDIRIQVYGDMAIVAFRLAGETQTKDGIQTDYYLNSGTFIKRDRTWKAVSWQATKAN